MALEELNEPERELVGVLVEALVKGVGPGFHPDTDALDYVFVGESETKYSYGAGVATAVNHLREMLFNVLGDDFYAVAEIQLRRYFS